jgi:hypothetical protein
MVPMTIDVNAGGWCGKCGRESSECPHCEECGRVLCAEWCPYNDSEEEEIPDTERNS